MHRRSLAGKRIVCASRDSWPRSLREVTEARFPRRSDTPTDTAEAVAVLEPVVSLRVPRLFQLLSCCQPGSAIENARMSELRLGLPA